MDLNIIPEHEFEHLGCKFRCRIGTNDEDVVRSVFSGEYALPDSSHPEYRAVAFDIGAHIGAYSVWACHKYSGLQVLAVEPLPENVRLLRLNIAANELEGRVEVLSGAVGSKSDLVEIAYGDPGTESGFIHQFVGNGNSFAPSLKKVKVQAHRFKNLALLAKIRFGIDGVWCIKSDCEGGEVTFFSEADLGSVQWVIGEEHGGIKALDEAFKAANFKKHPQKHPSMFCYENANRPL